MFAERLKDALGAEYVVMGGRNFKNVKKLPSGARLGDNRNVFVDALASGIQRPAVDGINPLLNLEQEESAEEEAA